jgi:DNA-directed RNA polymerase specialized sigma24 family protein
MFDNKFVFISGALVPVSPELYTEYNRYARRERSQHEKEMRHGVVSLEGRGAAGQPAPIELTPAPQVNTQHLLEEDELHLSLKYAILSLTPDERTLIFSHFWEQKPLSQISRESGVPVRTLSYRRKVILQKLRLWLFN